MHKGVHLMLFVPCGACACAERATAPAPATRLTGVWVPTGSNPDGLAEWPDTPWPSRPPFTDWGAAESKRLDDHDNFKPCTPAGPVYFMREIGLFPIQFLES